jgi:hypothetical protein
MLMSKIYCATYTKTVETIICLFSLLTSGEFY